MALVTVTPTDQALSPVQLSRSEGLPMVWRCPQENPKSDLFMGNPRWESRGSSLLGSRAWIPRRRTLLALAPTEVALSDRCVGRQGAVQLEWRSRRAAHTP